MGLANSRYNFQMLYQLLGELLNTNDVNIDCIRLQCLVSNVDPYGQSQQNAARSIYKKKKKKKKRRRRRRKSKTKQNKTNTYKKKERKK